MEQLEISSLWRLSILWLALESTLELENIKSAPADLTRISLSFYNLLDWSNYQTETGVNRWKTSVIGHCTVVGWSLTYPNYNTDYA